MEPQLIASTPNPACPACQKRERHCLAEYRHFHPLGGHGYCKETGFTHLEIENARKEIAKNAGNLGNA